MLKKKRGFFYSHMRSSKSRKGGVVSFCLVSLRLPWTVTAWWRSRKEKDVRSGLRGERKPRLTKSKLALLWQVNPANFIMYKNSYGGGTSVTWWLSTLHHLVKNSITSWIVTWTKFLARELLEATHKLSSNLDMWAFVCFFRCVSVIAVTQCYH